MSSSPPGPSLPGGHSLYAHLNASMRKLKWQRPATRESDQDRSPQQATSASPPGGSRPPTRSGLLPQWMQRNHSTDLLRPSFRQRDSDSSSESFYCQPPPFSNPSTASLASPRTRPPPDRERLSPPTERGWQSSRRPAHAARALPTIDTLRGVPLRWPQHEPLHLEVYHPITHDEAPVDAAPLRAVRPYGSVPPNGVRMAPTVALTLRALVQRGLLQNLGLRYNSVHKRDHHLTSEQQWLASDVLLAASWRAFVEVLAPDIVRGGFTERAKEQVHARAQGLMQNMGALFGLREATAKELALHAREQWDVLNSRRDSLMTDQYEPYEWTSVSPQAHFLVETKNDLVRICASRQPPGIFRVHYLVGTALQLGTQLHRIDTWSEHHLACEDADFEAMLHHVWRSSKTQNALLIYQTHRALLREQLERERVEPCGQR